MADGKRIIKGLRQAVEFARGDKTKGRRFIVDPKSKRQLEIIEGGKRPKLAEIFGDDNAE